MKVNNFRIFLRFVETLDRFDYNLAPRRKTITQFQMYCYKYGVK